MKIKTSELIESALDLAVWQCDPAGIQVSIAPFKGSKHLYLHGQNGKIAGDWGPSRFWAQGGPIIERKVIRLNSYDGGKTWVADMGNPAQAEGPTPLIAAMRCHVISELGEYVDIPEELL